MILGTIFLVFGLIFWFGQIIVLIKPSLATKIGLVEEKSKIDPTLYIIESKIIPLIDFLLAWTFPFAAYLMISENNQWPIWGLIGAGIFTYSSLHIVYSRIIFHKNKIRTGSVSSTNTAYVFGILWFLMGVLMIMLSLRHLSIY